MKTSIVALTLLAAGLLVTGPAISGAGDTRLADGGRNSWYGPSRDDRGGSRGNWAVGTFHGQNGANGNEETLTIRPDGSVELRTRGEAPKYGTFEGETLTLGSRISKVEPARGGIVIDGAYYRR
jgi:hypothetical protein